MPDFLVISEEECRECSGFGDYFENSGPNPSYKVKCKTCLGTGRKLVSLKEALATIKRAGIYK